VGNARQTLQFCSQILVHCRLIDPAKGIRN
jgi:hypothetical protein